MSPTPSKPQADWLLANMSWIRALARSLVADAQSAEDLVQQTCVIALEGDPRGESSFRAWIRAVMRNLLGRNVRRDDQRHGWERAAARSEELEPADELVERAALQNVLVESVLELDEHYRTVLLMRYLEELPPREIAKRLDVSVHTVKTRLHRALQRIREELVRRHGGESPVWFSSLVALALGAGDRPGSVLGLSIMNAKASLSLAAGALTLVGVGSLFLNDEAAATAPVEVARPSSASVVPPRVAEGASGVSPTSGRSRALAPAAVDVVSTPTAVDGARAPWRTSGRVLDDEGWPRAGVPLVERGSGERRTSGDGGWFEFELASAGGRIESDSDRWVTIAAGLTSRGSKLEPTVVVAERIDVLGEVVDEDGLPLERVHIALHEPPGFEGRFESRGEASVRVARVERTLRDGRFALLGYPAIQGAELYFQLEGYAPRTVALPEVDSDLRIVLERPAAPAEGRLTGIVRAFDGAPVAGARVAMGLDSVVTDDGGAFELDLARSVTVDRLVAASPGFLPGELRLADVSHDGAWPEHVEVWLGDEALRLSGRVVDGDGQPVAGAHVWVDDPTRLGVDGRSPLALESYLAGGSVPVDPLGSRRDLPERDGESNWGPWWRPQQPSALWHWTETDASGRFTLEGLLDRTYRVRVMDPEALLSTVSDPIDAGERDATVVLPRANVHARLEGQVVDEAGAPVAGVRLSLFRRANTATSRVFGGTVRAVYTRRRETVASDEEGRFVFEGVPREGMELDVGGEDIVPTFVRVPAQLPATGFVVQVGVRRHFRLELAQFAEDVTSVEARSATGDHVEMWYVRGDYRSSQTSFEVVDGRSPVLSVGPDAATLVLVGPEGVVDERSLRPLARGDVNVLR